MAARFFAPLQARALLLALAIFMPLCTHARAADSGLEIEFNEDFIRSLHSPFSITDSLSVFARIFAELPEKVFVYPTENYYYFSFVANGHAYSGNIRLAPDAWTTRRIYFAYGDKVDPANTRYITLGPEHGVLVQPVAHLRYWVFFAGKRVEFELNGLPETMPTSYRLLPWEILIGRSMDESGIAFLLMYSLAYGHFFWVLDEEVGPDWPMRALGPNVRQHLSSGFIFFDDVALDRHILIGVDRSEVVRNSYHDGPFDQLPDNVLARTPFAELAQRSFPALRGLINRRGEYHGRPVRIALLNYRIYSHPHELVVWASNCAAQAERRAELYACLTRLSRGP